MARPKASAAGVGDALRVLRAKYADLARKYAVVAERLDRRVGHDLALYRFGSLGLRGSDPALALVARDGIRLANALFTQLAKRLRGPLSPIEPETGPVHPNLRRLILEHAERMLGRRSGPAELR